MLKYNKNKKFRGFSKKNRGFLKFSKIEFGWRQIFENLIIHKPSLGSREIPQFGPDRLSRFDVYCIQTNRQTPEHPKRQTPKPNLLIDSICMHGAVSLLFNI